MSLHSLGKRLQNNFPTASIEIDEPADSHGGSFLDVRLDDHTVIIEWRKRRGFGISARPDIEYGAGVDETYDSEDEAFKRVVTLLVSKTQTIPQVKLRELREARGLSQMELADRMDVQQASISKLEHGRDMRVSTLRSLVAALGGELAIVAKFPDGTERRLDVPSHAESE